jgi:predicted nuclease with TOPRIM domain
MIVIEVISLFQAIDGVNSENKKLNSNILILAMLKMIKSDLDILKTENKELKEENFKLKTTFELEVLRKENETLKTENQKLKTKTKNLKKEMNNLKTTFELEVRAKENMLKTEKLMLKKEKDVFYHEHSVEDQFVEYNQSVDKLRGALYALKNLSLVDINASSIGNDSVKNLICAKPSLNFYTQDIENSWISVTLNSK